MAVDKIAVFPVCGGRARDTVDTTMTTSEHDRSRRPGTLYWSGRVYARVGGWRERAAAAVAVSARAARRRENEARERSSAAAIDSATGRAGRGGNRRERVTAVPCASRPLGCCAEAVLAAAGIDDP